LQSPLVRTISTNDSLQNAGHGIYVLGCDAKQSSTIDLSYHRFKIDVADVLHIDTIKMDVMHVFKDTITPVNGKISVTLRAENLIDSAYLYYKDPLWTTFSVEKICVADSVFTFSITPPKDGKAIQYYFKAWRGIDVYGYDKELYTPFVSPDLGSLSKFEIIPSSQDTVTYPSGYTIEFLIKGYYSSTFIPGEIDRSESIVWGLSDAQGCILSATTGKTVTVKTGNGKSLKPVILTVTIDTTKIRMIPGAKNTAIIPFYVSGSALKTIIVLRTDAGNPNPIKNSAADKAEFSAKGMDEKKNLLNITPAWSISPAFAGTITSSGVFKPSGDYVGNVRIFAQATGIAGEFVSEGSSVAGLNVHYMILRKSIPDTAISSEGCKIIFPPGVVKAGDVGVLDFSSRELKNKIRRSTGLFKTVDSIAYEIKEMENVAFELSSDSIRIEMDVPTVYRSGNREMFIGRWSEDSLCWFMLKNSLISADKSKISAALTHFSAYSLLVKSGNTIQLEISPNPFSSYVRPKHPQLPYYGTCISFQAESQDRNLYKINVKIYNVTGDLVWSMTIPNANTNPYQVWWDGKTSSKDIFIEEPLNVIAVNGDKMCRNGRYFVVLSMVDANGKERRMMKQMVLMK
jgi:hypothetical protein